MPLAPRPAPPRCRGNATQVNAQAEAQQADAMKQANIEAELALLSEEIDGDFDVALSMSIASMTGNAIENPEVVTSVIICAFEGIRAARGCRDMRKAYEFKEYQMSLRATT